MLSSATAFDTTVKVKTWATGAKQHAEIIFSAADNAFEAGE
jgi:accessory colonization factor AcfC